MASSAAGSSFGERHALQQLAAGEPGVDQDAGAGGGDDRAVAFGARGENSHAHELENTPARCGFRGWSDGFGSPLGAARVWFLISCDSYQPQRSLLAAQNVNTVAGGKLFTRPPAVGAGRRPVGGERVMSREKGFEGRPAVELEVVVGPIDVQVAGDDDDLGRVREPLLR